MALSLVARRIFVRCSHASVPDKLCVLLNPDKHTNISNLVHDITSRVNLKGQLLIHSYLNDCLLLPDESCDILRDGDEIQIRISVCKDEKSSKNYLKRKFSSTTLAVKKLSNVKKLKQAGITDGILNLEESASPSPCSSLLSFDNAIEVSSSSEESSNAGNEPLQSESRTSIHSQRQNVTRKRRGISKEPVLSSPDKTETVDAPHGIKSFKTSTSGRCRASKPNGEESETESTRQREYDQIDNHVEQTGASAHQSGVGGLESQWDVPSSYKSTDKEETPSVASGSAPEDPDPVAVPRANGSAEAGDDVGVGGPGGEPPKKRRRRRRKGKKAAMGGRGEAGGGALGKSNDVGIKKGVPGSSSGGTPKVRTPKGPLASRLRGAPLMHIRFDGRPSGGDGQLDEALNADVDSEQPAGQDATPTSTSRAATGSGPRRDYSLMQALYGPPRIFDKIAFKQLTMDENYCPTISDYVEADVIPFDPDTDEFTMKIINNTMEPVKKTGRFELPSDESGSSGDESEDSDILVQLKFGAMIQPKLM